MFDLLVLETSQITIEDTETFLTIEVYVDEHSTRTTWNYDVRQLLFGKVKMSDLLKYFYQ